MTSTTETCFRRGGVCDCGPRPCALPDDEYLTYERRSLPGRKTPIVVVLSKSGGYPLGEIVWHGAWRQFVLRPVPVTIWNKGCLNDVLGVIDVLTKERRS